MPYVTNNILREKFEITFGFIFNQPLGKRHPFRALTRFIYWQCQTLFFPSKFFIKSFVKPVNFYVKKGLYGITTNIYIGLHEFYDMSFLLHFLRERDLFIDVGANAGSYTLLASGICKAKTIAIEPIKLTFDFFFKNVQLNGLGDNVSMINAGAGAKAGSMNFTTDEDITNHVIAANETHSTNITTVPIVTIDSIQRENQPSLIKIDVEGFETEVLKGMANTLTEPSLKAIIIEINGSGARYNYNDENIHLLLIAHNFKPHLYDPFKRELLELDSYGGQNTIYCRDMDFINDRLKTATGFKIMGETI